MKRRTRAWILLLMTLALGGCYVYYEFFYIVE